MLLILLWLQVSLIAGREYCNIYNQRLQRHVPMLLQNGIIATCSGCYMPSPFPDMHGIKATCPKFPSARRLGVFVADAKELWSNGVVCIDIKRHTFTSFQLQVITQAMNIIKNATATIQFVTQKQCHEGVSAKSFPSSSCRGCQQVVEIENVQSTGCFSEIGMTTDSPQLMHLNNNCFGSRKDRDKTLNFPGVIVHEFLHLLGLDHEHQHVNSPMLTLWDNIRGGEITNYVREYSLRTTPYDQESIMHYPETLKDLRSAKERRVLCFPLPRCSTTREQAPCIPDDVVFCTAKYHSNCVIPNEQEHCLPVQPQVGQRTKLSAGDRETLLWLYPHEHHVPRRENTTMPGLVAESAALRTKVPLRLIYLFTAFFLVLQ